MSKIYCKNCKWFYFASHLINYKEGRSNYYCLYPDNKCEYLDYKGDTCLHRESTEPKIINKNFECEWYKRKFWKWWVKK